MPHINSPPTPHTRIIAFLPRPDVFRGPLGPLGPRALLLGVHVGHDGPNFAQNVGPAQSRNQDNDGAGDPFEDVPGLQAVIARVIHLYLL